MIYTNYILIILYIIKYILMLYIYNYILINYKFKKLNKLTNYILQLTIFFI